MVAEMVAEEGGRANRIKVAGGFHSPLMSDAAEALRRVLGKCSRDMSGFVKNSNIL